MVVGSFLKEDGAYIIKMCKIIHIAGVRWKRKEFILPYGYRTRTSSSLRNYLFRFPSLYSTGIVPATTIT